MGENTHIRIHTEHNEQLEEKRMPRYHLGLYFIMRAWRVLDDLSFRDELNLLISPKYAVVARHEILLAAIYLTSNWRKMSCNETPSSRNVYVSNTINKWRTKLIAGNLALMPL